MNLYLVRHGFSTGNRDQRIQGQWDTDLTTEGWRQAGTTGRFLAHYFAGMGWPVNALYSSDLKRAWHTAEAIGRQIGLAPIPEPGLREMHAGRVEGMTTAEWQAAFPDLDTGWHDRANLDWGWPGGETRRQLIARASRTIDGIVARHGPLDNVIAVTHGGIIRAYLNNAVRWGDEVVGAEARAGNCSISQVQFDAEGSTMGVGCLLVLNSMGHLQDPLAEDGNGHAAPALTEAMPDADRHL